MAFRALFLFLFIACLVPACAGKSNAQPAEQPEGKACTKEAKVCPDGSSVGRTGPNCEFAPCPEGGSEAPESPEAAAPSAP